MGLGTNELFLSRSTKSVASTIQVPLRANGKYWYLLLLSINDMVKLRMVYEV